MWAVVQQGEILPRFRGEMRVAGMRHASHGVETETGGGLKMDFEGRPNRTCI